MYSKEITITNPTGIHARPASQLVARAGKFMSAITLCRPDDTSEYNVKSIMMLLALGLETGENAILSADGEDEKLAVEELAEFIRNLNE